MTNYDPFAYGNVRLDPNRADGSGGVEADADAEDMLFDGSPAQPVVDPESSWSLITDDVDGLLPRGAPPPADSLDFVPETMRPADEEPPDAAAATEPPRRPRVETGGRPAEPVAEMSQAGPVRNHRPPVRRRPLRDGRPAESGDAVEPTRRPRLPGRRRRPVAAVVMPLALCGGGGSAAAWFWMTQQNPIMAALIGVTTLVAALFTWLLLRG